MKFKSYLGIQRRVNQLLESAASCKDYISQMMYGHAGEVKPSQELVDEMRKEFPSAAGTIYLGQNFTNKTDYETFLAQTKNGTEFSSDTMTIWVNDEKLAYRGAISDNYGGYRSDKMYKDKDHMTGVAGIVLKLTVKEGEAVSAGAASSSYNDAKVLLPPGTYATEVVGKHQPFVDTISDANFKAEFMAIKSIRSKESSTKTRKMFEHILYHYEDMDNEMRQHLFKLLDDALQDIEYDVSVSMRNSYHGFNKSQIPEISISWNVPSSFVYYFDLMNEEDAEVIVKKVQDVLSKIDHEFRSKTTDVDWVEEFDLNVNPSLIAMADLSHFQNKVHFAKYLQRKIGLTYNSLNSYEETKRINRIEDQNEKRDAIRALGKRIENALNLLGKLSGKQ